MKWWIENGYDYQKTPKTTFGSGQTDLEEIRRERLRATIHLTDYLKSKYDAVWFKGSAMYRPLDGDQVCLFDSSRVYKVDKTLVKSGEIGSKIVAKVGIDPYNRGVIIPIGTKGIIVDKKKPDERQEWAKNSEWIYSIKWEKGGTMWGILDSWIEPYVKKVKISEEETKIIRRDFWKTYEEVYKMNEGGIESFLPISREEELKVVAFIRMNYIGETGDQIRKTLRKIKHDRKVIQGSGHKFDIIDYSTIIENKPTIFKIRKTNHGVGYSIESEGSYSQWMKVILPSRTLNEETFMSPPYRYYPISRKEEDEVVQHITKEWTKEMGLNIGPFLKKVKQLRKVRLLPTVDVDIIDYRIEDIAENWPITFHIMKNLDGVGFSTGSKFHEDNGDWKMIIPPKETLTESENSSQISYPVITKEEELRAIFIIKDDWIQPDDYNNELGKTFRKIKHDRNSRVGNIIPDMIQYEGYINGIRLIFSIEKNKDGIGYWVFDSPPIMKVRQRFKVIIPSSKYLTESVAIGKRYSPMTRIEELESLRCIILKMRENDRDKKSDFRKVGQRNKIITDYPEGRRFADDRDYEYTAYDGEQYLLIIRKRSDGFFYRNISMKDVERMPLYTRHGTFYPLHKKPEYLKENTINEELNLGKFEDDFFSIKYEMQLEFQTGKKHQNWRLIPARELLSLWMTFGKYKRVDEDKLYKIWEIVKENVIKIIINTEEWRDESTEFFGVEDRDQITDKLRKKHAWFISDLSKNKWIRNSGEEGGNARYSDQYQTLYKLLNKCYSLTTSEGLLVGIDTILNFVHGLGPMAHWFVEGGTTTLDRIKNFQAKGIVIPENKVSVGNYKLRENDSDHGEALRQTGYWGKAGAGAIILSKRTGRILLPYRSTSVEQPNTWGVWGGAIDSNEDPAQAVSREISEEVGVTTQIDGLIPLYVYEDPRVGFRYHNFLAVVPDEFQPRLNWETENYRWVDFGDWPSPLHFGLKLLLQNSKNQIFEEVKKYTPQKSAEVPTNQDKEKYSAAVYAIKKVWQSMFRVGEKDKFSGYDFRMYASNEQSLQNMFEEFGKKFFPQSHEPAHEFLDYAETVLEKLEQIYNKRRAAKMNPNDPLFLLKKIVIGKTWEGAKQSLEKVSLATQLYKGGRVSDEQSELLFNRLYRIALGETMYDMKKISNMIRLSDVRSTTNDPNDHINTFLRYNTTKGSTKFPDRVQIYRGTPSPLAKIRPGDFVTLDKDYARDYMRGKYGTVISDILPSKDLLVQTMEPEKSHLIYWPEGHQIKKIENVPTFREFYNQWATL
jgi:8-oxo-dGTP pyrophosphatase MutT (NUDIX family)